MFRGHSEQSLRLNDSHITCEDQCLLTRACRNHRLWLLRYIFPLVPQLLIGDSRGNRLGSF